MSLAGQLEQAAVAGRIVTPLHDVYRKARMLCSGDPGVTFGLGHLLPATPAEIIDGLGRLTGAEIPPEGRVGRERSWVEPGTLVTLADAAAERLRFACARGQRVLFGTGHPAGPIEMYVRLADAMRARGAEILRFAEAEGFAVEAGYGRGQIRYLCDVACLSSGGDLLHSHSPRPMEYLLDTGPRPDLVVGDHGMAGAAIARGIETLSIADVNDPALVVAHHLGKAGPVVVMDDNVDPEAYWPCFQVIAARFGAG